MHALYIPSLCIMTEIGNVPLTLNQYYVCWVLYNCGLLLVLLLGYTYAQIYLRLYKLQLQLNCSALMHIGTYLSWHSLLANSNVML